MATVTQAVTLILAAIGSVVSVVALVVNRKNAREATEAKTRVDGQTLAHQELVDSLAVMSGLVEQYRKQGAETRLELDDVKKEHRRCRDDLAKMGIRLQHAEARIAELGG